MATGYDRRVTVPLDRRRVMAAGERMLAEHTLSPDLTATIEQNLAQLRAAAADPPQPPKRHSRAGPD